MEPNGIDTTGSSLSGLTHSFLLLSRLAASVVLPGQRKMAATNISEVYVPLVDEKARPHWKLLVPDSQGRTLIGSAQAVQLRG